MLTKYSDVRAETTNAVEFANTQLRTVLWSAWTLFVVAFAFVHWQFDFAANRPSPIVGLIIHTVLAGLVGLIVMTVVEMRLNPERFTDTPTQGNNC